MTKYRQETLHWFYNVERDDSVWDSPPQAFQTRPRQPREVLPGAPSV